MKKSILSTALFTLAALGAGSAFAGGGNNYPTEKTPSVSTKTRAQVKAELAEAIRVGDIIADSERGLTAYQLNPSAYPARPSAMGKTRAQVQDELAKAHMDGSLARAKLQNQGG
ncbi:MAG: DUF4148 domain-containing protein [Hydrogenophaga sp.]|nr:DUF4148 domain-containing protein [Hydrogenophaga sp.]